MKKLLLIAMLSFAWVAQAQETFEFKIYDITIKTKEGEQAVNDSIRGTLYLDQLLSLEIYSDGKSTYYTEIEMNRSGNRVKLKERNVVKDAKTGQPIAKTKWIKTVHFIKNSFIGEINGYAGQQVLINKDNYYFIKGTYKRSITYGN